MTEDKKNLGWIKLWRSFLKWEWFDDPNTLKVFLYVLLKVNHSTKKWMGIEIKRGEFLTGRQQMAKDLKISEQSVRTSLKRLKSTSEITIKSTNKYSIIQVLNFEKYNDANQQSNQLANQQLTSNQPATNQQLTTTKNDKNEKNEKNIGVRFAPPTQKEVRDYFSEKEYSLKLADQFYFFYDSKNWMVGKNKMQKWRSAAARWFNDHPEAKTQPLKKLGEITYT